ncbi:hypothetical protein DsansV1_C01g0000371 [Dioscorea sansibarensis]
MQDAIVKTFTKKKKKKKKKKKEAKLDLKRPGGELNPNGGLGLQAELVPGEPGEDVGFPDARVADEHDLEQVIILMVPSLAHLRSIPCHCRAATLSDSCASKSNHRKTKANW